MRGNKLKLNPDKTHILTMGTAKRLSNLKEKINVTMGGDTLKEDKSKSEILLGCKIEASMKWHQQVDFVKSKLKKRLGALSRLKFCLPINFAKIIAEGIFNSILIYCLPLYGGCDIGEIKDLQIIQNKAAQIVTNSPPRSQRSEMYNQLNWLTVNQLIFYHTMIAVFKTRKFKEPEYLSGILNNDNRNGRIKTPRIKLVLTEKSFTHRGSVGWNSLPDSIRSAEKIGEFKKNLRIWIQQHVIQFL